MSSTTDGSNNRREVAAPRLAGVNLLAWILVLQVLTLFGQWSGRGTGVGGAETALAQVPDAGAQRLEIINQLKDLNQRIDKLTDLLAGGNLQVKLTKEPDNKGS